MATVPQQLSVPVQLMRLSVSPGGRPIAIDSETDTSPDQLHSFTEYDDPAWPYTDRIWVWFTNQTNATKLVFLNWRASSPGDVVAKIPVQLAAYETRLVADGWPGQFQDLGAGNWNGISAHADTGDGGDVVAVGVVHRHFQVGDPSGATA